MRCYKISGPPESLRDIYAFADCLLCFATRPRVSIVVEPGFLGWERSEKPAKSVITVGFKNWPDFGDVARELPTVSEGTQLIHNRSQHGRDDDDRVALPRLARCDRLPSEDPG